MVEESDAGREASPSTNGTCMHMIEMAEKLGLERDPATGKYLVKQCITVTDRARGDRCDRIIPLGRTECCYCQGKDFGPAPEGVIELGTCHYRCKRCKRVTQECDVSICAYCRGTIFVRLPPVIIIDRHGMRNVAEGV